MPDEKWQKVREVFHAALSRKPEDRQSFVNEACGADKSLIAEVESLLSSHDNAESFMETPAVAKVAGMIEPDLPRLEKGQNFGRYEIIGQIGAGGMGEVYLAEDRRLERKIALKILPPIVAEDEERMLRFVREAKSSSALNHPNIITIYEIGETANTHFIAIEHIEGETLRERLKGDPINLKSALDIAIQVVSGLDAAHRAGIVHRDIKPENVMIRPDGLVKVLDFGIAKLIQKRNELDSEAATVKAQTRPGVIIGTVAYMSPEQARGKAVDARSDIFSFGVMLYEILAGKPPFEGDTAIDTIGSILNKEPVPLSHTAEVPHELERIINKALRKDREERYQTAKDLLIDLKDVREDLEFQNKLERTAVPDRAAKTQIFNPTTSDIATRHTSANSIISSIKRHKPLAAFVSLALLIGAIGLAYYYFSKGKPATSGSGKRSIAVLPLKPINKANRDDIYEIGIADSLIQRLSSMRGFIVRPLSAIRKYADLEQDPISAGQEQQVDYVLVSNYQIANGKIRVTSQLLNVESGQIEETYKSEKDAGDVFAMQDAIASEVENILQGRFATVSSSPTTKRGTNNEEAYRLYLQGMYFNDKRQEPEAWNAIDAFEQAVRLDPNYARAWAGIAHTRRGISNFVRDADIHEQHRKSMEAVKRALELDPNLSEAYSALCENKHNYEYDFAGAETACKRAIELDPNSPLAHNIFARFLIGAGRRFDEAIAEIKTAIDLEPTSVFHQVVYTVVLTYARHYDEAARQLERLAQRNPRAAVNYFFLVGGVAMNGDHAAAFERLTRFQKLAGTDEETVRIFKTAYESAGWQGVLREQAKRAYDTNPGMFFPAVVYAQIGDKDKAFEYLEKSFQRREQWMAYLQSDPRLDSLRGDLRFEELVRRVESK